MAFSKAHRFNASDYHYSLLCRALAHPARLAILRRLAANGPTPADILISGMPISQPAASQHLRILREMHILNCEQQSPTVIYWLNEELTNTHRGILNLLLKADGMFDTMHENEIGSLSRLFRASASGI